jgi:uncharacterized protein (TIGR03437 family)
MKSMKSFLAVWLLASLGICLSAQPAIRSPFGILNSASYAYPGLPNSSIAQGSLFAIFGTNLGPSAPVNALTFPLQTTLGGTSIQVTSGGTTVAAVPLYVSATQINAVLPSNTPTGSATLTVTYNTQQSAAEAFQVIANSVGVYSVASNGTGAGAITNNVVIYGPTNPAHPGDTSVMWATGLGPVQGNEFAGPLPGNMPNVPVEIFVGGQQASVGYRGRSGCCTGLDQIVFTVPSGALGCNVPVAVQINNVVSNFTTMPIAAAGTSTCTDSSGTIDYSQFQAKGTVSLGSVSLSRTALTETLPAPIGTVSGTTDTGSATFYKYTYQQITESNPLQAYSFGACTVFVYAGNSAAIPTAIPTPLDAGKPITVTGPNGAMTLTEQSTGLYSATLGGGVSIPGEPAPPPLYLSPGAYTVTGPGGSAVGAFSTNLTVYQPLDWTNESAINIIERASGQSVTWSGGNPNGTVMIEGYSAVPGTNPNGSDTVGGIFICYAPDSAGQFSIPPVVLLSLPPSGTTGGISLGAMIISNYTSTSFSASGLDLGYASTSDVVFKLPVAYQ